MKPVFLLFGLALIFSLVSMNWVQVENAMSAYLPDTTETRQGLDRMEEQFITYGTAKVMVTNIPYAEAVAISEEIESLETVIMLAFDSTEEHYNNFSALYDITFGYEETDNRALDALDEVEAMLEGYDVYVSTSMGDASAEQIASEMQVISVLVAIVVVSVLLLTSETWAEVPVLLLTFCSAALITKGLAEELDEMSNATLAVISSIGVLSNQAGQQMLDALQNVKGDMRDAVNHLQNGVESVKSASRGVRSIVDYVNAQPDLHFSKLGEEFDRNRENLHGQLTGMLDSIKNLGNHASDFSDVVNEDLRAVNDQINIIFNLLADNLMNYAELSVEELYEEIDDEDMESITTGKTADCTNKGIIKGERAVPAGGYDGGRANILCGRVQILCMDYCSLWRRRRGGADNIYCISEKIEGETETEKKAVGINRETGGGRQCSRLARCPRE